MLPYRVAKQEQKTDSFRSCVVQTTKTCSIARTR